MIVCVIANVPLVIARAANVQLPNNPWAVLVDLNLTASPVQSAIRTLKGVPRTTKSPIAAPLKPIAIRFSIVRKIGVLTEFPEAESVPQRSHARMDSTV